MEKDWVKMEKPEELLILCSNHEVFKATAIEIIKGYCKAWYKCYIDDDLAFKLCNETSIIIIKYEEYLLNNKELMKSLMQYMV